MNELLPIIRRKRRPLLPVEVAPEPPKVLAETDKTDGTPAGNTTEPGGGGGEPNVADDETSEI